MGFDDLPIPNNGTTHTVTSPLGLGTVANYTKNPILDVGYQCKDARPYFAFKYSTTTYYIRVHPNNLTVGDQIGMYAASTITKFGITYTKMTRQSGKGTVATVGSSATITYSGNTYAYDSTSDVDVFLNKLNPWSFYKPYEFTGLVDTEYGQTRCNDLDNNTSNWDNIIRSQNIRCGFNYNIDSSSNTNVYCSRYDMALDNAHATNSVWNYTRPSTIFRLTDFIGYNKNAVCPGSCGQWSKDMDIIKTAVATPSYSYEYDASDSNCEIDILSIDSELRGNNPTWYFGAIVSKVSLSGKNITARTSSTFYPAGAVNTVAPVSPVGELPDIVAQNITFSSVGDYEVCWVLARGNSSNVSQNQPYIILPYGYFLVNYSMQNQDVMVVPYAPTFTSTYPSAEIISDAYFDFVWSASNPVSSNGSIMDIDRSTYTTVKFFFTVTNDSNSQQTVNLNIATDQTTSPNTYGVTKSITIAANSNYNISVSVPFNQAKKFGDDVGGTASAGVGYKVSYSYNSGGSGPYYVDIVNANIVTTDPGYQYLYSSMYPEHWLLNSSWSYIWTNNHLNSYAPVLNDSSIIAV